MPTTMIKSGFCARINSFWTIGIAPARPPATFFIPNLAKISPGKLASLNATSGVAA